MKILIIILSLILISVGSVHADYNVDKLAKALNPIYLVWKVNGKETKEEYGFHLIFNINNPREIEIPNFKQVLNGQSHILLSCYGRIIPPANNGYIVGTAIEGPTFGKIIIFDNNFRKLAEVDSQKVVKIKLIGLLGDDVGEIVTWEDHHYGTNTTRRVLNVYKLYPGNKIKKIFEHDLIDATFMPGGPHGVNKEIYYSIDYQSLMKQKKIVVINQDTGNKEVFSWDGVTYKGKDCQMIPKDGE
jgi:hypothetical protein